MIGFWFCRRPAIPAVSTPDVLIIQPLIAPGSPSGASLRSWSVEVVSPTTINPVSGVCLIQTALSMAEPP